jgi:4-oxalocrotonate tautomerase
MPLIQVRALEGVFSKEQKQEIVKKLTETMVLIGGEDMRAITRVLVVDVPSGSWVIGGPLNNETLNAC